MVKLLNESFIAAALQFLLFTVVNLSARGKKEKDVNPN